TAVVPLVLDAEGLLARRLLFAHLDGVHPGHARPAAAPLDQPVDRWGRSLEDGLDAAIRKVPYRAGHAGRHRLFARVPPEPHTLHVSGDQHANTLAFAGPGQLWHCGQKYELRPEIFTESMGVRHRRHARPLRP